MRARTTTASTAMAAGPATGTAMVMTMMTICEQHIRGESAACMPGHLAEKRVEDTRQAGRNTRVVDHEVRPCTTK